MEKIVESGERITTIVLDGTECAVKFASKYRVFCVKSDSDVTVSLASGKSAGDDGVMVCKAGESIMYPHMRQLDTVYITGSGSVAVYAGNEAVNPFKSGQKGGESIASGASAYTLTNAVDYPLLGLSLYGKSTQNGTPTPENPVEIVSVGDGGSVGITARGKNLLKINSVILKQADYIYDQKISLRKDIYYTFSLISSSNCVIYITPVYTNGTLESDKWRCNLIAFIKNKITFKSTKDISKLRIYATNIGEFNEMQIELGSTATDFKPYKGTTAAITSSMPLCGIAVDSGGNYTDSNGQQWICDELIYNANGSGKIVKNTVKISSYNGEEITTPYISTTGELTEGATVIYQLSEPQEISLTAAEIATLMELQTYNGVTNISNDSGAEMDVNYCINKNLSDCVMPITTALQAQIDELKSAVLSLGGNV